jgi:hypothetical protein
MLAKIRAAHLPEQGRERAGGPRDALAQLARLEDLAFRAGLEDLARRMLDDGDGEG